MEIEAENISAQDANSSFAFNSLNLPLNGKLFNSFSLNQKCNYGGGSLVAKLSAVDARFALNRTRASWVRFPVTALKKNLAVLPLTISLVESFPLGPFLSCLGPSPLKLELKTCGAFGAEYVHCSQL